MKKPLSRRDFLKLAGLGLGALAFRHYPLPLLEDYAIPKRLAQFPEGKTIGRVVDAGVKLRSRRPMPVRMSCVSWKRIRWWFGAGGGGGCDWRVVQPALC